ncbi:hypothetical protein C0991_011676 [Blastosporella zonata]|nr:hypothetical protein C0991_011676 [Blastosporella zonata]
MDRRFVFLYTKNKKYGGFPGTNSGNAEEILRLLQPLADKLYTQEYNIVFEAIAKSKKWSQACHLMQTQASVFYAVALGKHVGIFIDRLTAERSLSEAEYPQYRKCDRYSTFEGAYMSMASKGAVSVDYLGQGLGDDPVNSDDLYNSDSDSDDVSPHPHASQSVTPRAPSTPPSAMPHATPKHQPIIAATPSTPNTLKHRPIISATPSTPNTPKHRPIISATPSTPLARSSTHINIGLSPTLHINMQDSHVDTNSSRVQSLSPTKVPREPKFGPWFDLYLETHRFSPDVAAIAERVFNQFGFTETEFVSAFAERVENVQDGEARFLFHLMTECPGVTPT